MAAEKEASCQSCLSDPNFAIICSFLEKFAATCGIVHPSFIELQEMIEEADTVPQGLIDLHIKLMRKARKTVSAEKWERALSKFCHTYSSQDAWELEKFGYLKVSSSVKLRLLKALLEYQFDMNPKFKAEVNKLSPNELRLEPLGRDQSGQTYWVQFDSMSHMRIYKEDPDEETWEMIAKDRNGLVALIDSLSSGEGQEELNLILNEDSNSQEIEKPITDTGQAEMTEDDSKGSMDGRGGVLQESSESNSIEAAPVVTKEAEKPKENGIKEETQDPVKDSAESQETRAVPPESQPIPPYVVGINHEILSHMSEKFNEMNKRKPEENGDAREDVKRIKEEPKDAVVEKSGEDREVEAVKEPAMERAKEPVVEATKESTAEAPKESDVEAEKEPVEAARDPVETAKEPVVKSEREPIEAAKESVIKAEKEPVEAAKESVVKAEKEPIEAAKEPVTVKAAEAPADDTAKEPVVGEAVEEPVQIIKGEGSGKECEAANPCLLEEVEVSEAIEEPPMLFVGLGSGAECDMGNPGPESETETKVPESQSSSDGDKAQEKKPKLWSIDTICSPEKTSQESSPTFFFGPGSLQKTVEFEKKEENRNCVDANSSEGEAPKEKEQNGEITEERERQGRKSRNNSTSQDNPEGVASKIRKTSDSKENSPKPSPEPSEKTEEKEADEPDKVEVKEGQKTAKSPVEKEVESKSDQEAEGKPPPKENSEEVEPPRSKEAPPKKGKAAKTSSKESTPEPKTEEKQEETKPAKKGRGRKKSAEEPKEEERQTRRSSRPATRAQGFSLSSFSMEDPSLLEPVQKPLKKQPAPQPSRKRKGRTQSKSEDEDAATGEQEEEEPEAEANAKRPRLRGKATKNQTQSTRQKVEVERAEKLDASSDEEEDEEEDGKKSDEEESEKSAPKKKSGTRRRKKSRFSRKKKSYPKKQAADSPQVTDGDSSQPTPIKLKEKPKKRSHLLGLSESDIKGVEISIDGERSVRASRRIAQLKIKEQSERKALEEATFLSIKEMEREKRKKKKKIRSEDGGNWEGSPKKKKRKRAKKVRESEDEFPSGEVEEDVKKRKKRKKKKRGLKYDINKPWQTSSDSSNDEEEDQEEYEDDEDDFVKEVEKSDHEFSPESDLEKEEEPEPIRRARTAQKGEDTAGDIEDYPCKKCGQPDHPEWILLCDKCDSGWHASCLRPPLMLIPEGDWFCPPCQHAQLVVRLKETLRRFERDSKRRENEELRRKRLAYVGISLANVLPVSKDKKDKKSKDDDDDDDEDDESSSDSSSDDSSDESGSSDEPVYQLRQRRTNTNLSHRLHEFDDLINSAIQEDMEAVQGAGNQGRGKDIETIVMADREEKLNPIEPSVAPPELSEVPGNPNPPLEVPASEQPPPPPTEQPQAEPEEEEGGEGWKPRVVPKNTSLPSAGGKKKARKLNSLDYSSDDANDSDEDFKGSSDYEEEEEEDSDGDDSDGSGRKWRGSKHQPVRRSTRNRVARIDKDFINDDSDDSDVPKKKKRHAWASSESEDSDETWGCRKRKSRPASSSTAKPAKSKKKKAKKYFDSDSDGPRRPKMKKPKIKFGFDDDEDTGGRRTRGKKVNYRAIVASDSDDDDGKPKKQLSDDEEEFVLDDENKESVEESEGIEEEEEEDEEEKEKGVAGEEIDEDEGAKKESRPDKPQIKVQPAPPPVSSEDGTVRDHDPSGENHLQKIAPGVAQQPPVPSPPQQESVIRGLLQSGPFYNQPRPFPRAPIYPPRAPGFHARPLYMDPSPSGGGLVPGKVDDPRFSAPPPLYPSQPPNFTGPPAWSGPPPAYEEPPAFPQEYPPQAPPPFPTQQPPSEEGSGEFGGLVSYFSSQHEDNLDT